MKLQKYLRRIPVGQRVGAIVTLVLLPLATLSAFSAVLLGDQEADFRESVQESIQTLLPLTTLEQYLQNALVDELQADSGEPVPDFATLSQDIDRSFSRIESTEDSPDLNMDMIQAAQDAWQGARPSVSHLIEQVRSIHASTRADDDAQARAKLTRAIGDIELARKHLSHAVKARYARAAAARHAQLLWLVWVWVVVLTAAAALVVVFLQSVLRPIRELGHAARRLGEGEHGVRATVEGNDEMTALAERFNEMAAYWEGSRQTLQVEASQDSLTGMLNRRGIMAALENALAVQAHRKESLSIFMMDLDRFKAINDHLGHSAGDRALVWVAGKIREGLRDGDQLGRYGGDEFMAVLPGATRDQAQQVAERITQSVQQVAAIEDCYPAVSIGIASAPDDGWLATTLIDVADASLYQRKKQRDMRTNAHLKSV